MEFNFIVDVPPDEECIKEFRMGIAEDLIQNHGIEFIKRVLEELDKRKDKLS